MMQYVFVFFLYFEHALDEINADLSSGVASWHWLYLQQIKMVFFIDILFTKFC